MLLSMTGFGEARRQHGPVTVTVEMRTINNRHFKLSVRSSEAYAGLEALVDGIVRSRIKRGSVQVDVRVDRVHCGDDYRINEAVLTGYRRQLAALSNSSGETVAVGLEVLLALPGVVEEDASRQADVARDWPLIEPVLQEALEAVGQTRAREGAALAEDLQANGRFVAERLEGIAGRLPQVADEYRARLVELVGKALERYDVALAPGDVIREVSLFLERSDISEELVRLRSHLDQFARTLAEPESAGRKLDFITQEMFREANTLGSKASDVQISQLVIEVKAAIERMREQVQNVE